MIKTTDTFTIQGTFKRRTFWQWLTRKPKELQVFIITGENQNEISK